MPPCEGKHLVLTFTLCAASHGVDRRDGPRETKPLFLQFALLPSGALLEDFDHSILLQELSVKCADSETHEIQTHLIRNLNPTSRHWRVAEEEVERCLPVLHLLVSVTRQRQVLVKTAVWRVPW